MHTEGLGDTGGKKGSSNDLHCLWNHPAPDPPSVGAEERKWNLIPCLETSGQISDLFSKCQSSETWLCPSGMGKELHPRAGRASAGGGAGSPGHQAEDSHGSPGNAPTSHYSSEKSPGNSHCLFFFFFLKGFVFLCLKFRWLVLEGVILMD